MGIDKVVLTSCEIDLVAGRCVRDGADSRLSSTEIRLIAYLVDNPRRDIPRGELLEQVFGYKETVRSRTIDTTIQRLRKKIEVNPADPDHVLTVHGIGYRFEPFVSPWPSFFPSRLSAVLPQNEDKFFGRTAQRDQVLHHFNAGVGVVTLVGPGGMGKTRFANWLALAVTDRWTCARVDASGTRTPDDLVHATIEALHSQAMGEEDPSYTISRILDQTPLLLVIDGMEHLAEQAELVQRWLSPDSPSRILVTSRIHLGIPNEVVVPLTPLSEREAAALFLARARLVQPGFAAAVDTQRLRKLVHRLDCMPLAIEVAAARARMYRPDELLDQIESGMAHLSAGGPGQSDHALTDALQWSWERLSEHEQSVLSQATVFRGGFELSSAEAILQTTEGAPPIAQLIESLLDQSLLSTASSPRGLRMTYYQTVHDFALKHLADATKQRVQAAHREHFLHLGAQWAAAANLGSTEGHVQLVNNFDNIAQVAQHGQPQEKLRALLCLAPVYLARGMSRRQVSELEAAIDDAEPLPPTLVPPAMRALTDYLLAVGRRSEAGAMYERGIAAAADDPGARYQLAARAGWLAMTSGDRDAAAAFRTLLEEAVDSGHEVHAVMARLGLAAMSLRALDLDEAEAHATRAANLLTDTGYEIYLVDALKVLAYVAEIRGDLVSVRHHYERTIRHIEHIEHPTSLAVQLGAFARALVSLSDEDADRATARELLDRARDVERTIGARIPTTNNIQARAMLYWEGGDLTEAQQILEQRLEESRKYGPMGTDGDLVGMLADIALDEGRLKAARTHFDKVFSLPHTRMAATLAHGGRALLHAQRGDMDAANEDLAAARKAGVTPILRATVQGYGAAVAVLTATDPSDLKQHRTQAEGVLKRLNSPRIRQWYLARAAARRLQEALSAQIV